MDPVQAGGSHQRAKSGTQSLLAALTILKERRVRTDDRLVTLRSLALRVDYHLEQIFAQDKREGYLSEFAGMDPRFDQEIQRLRSEHVRLRATSQKLLAKVRGPILEPELQERISEICQELESLLTKLNACHDQEDILFYRAFSPDLGGEC